MTITTPATGSSSLDEATVREIAALKVLNSKQEEVIFGSIFEHQRTLVIFVRHFFCGSCQAYVTQLCNLVPQENLDKSGIRVVLIGSGGPEVFDYYREATGFRGDIYTNPTTELYRALRMTITTQTTPEDQTRKSYLTSSKLGNALGSIWVRFYVVEKSYGGIMLTNNAGGYQKSVSGYEDWECLSKWW
ncbi:hypothetical protein CPB83DRAFT_854955 [Crepidotus variabilis]|uniref:Uncharacterized protein n=1 Tax=Crepidotus variabilis TaxID=179855 RepID=A0A9P6EFU5_9AGAR|nr:hypothetical protein CPB83DRAFT_854955 [Crepidotus variabilis]